MCSVCLSLSHSHTHTKHNNRKHFHRHLQVFYSACCCQANPVITYHLVFRSPCCILAPLRSLAIRTYVQYSETWIWMCSTQIRLHQNKYKGFDVHKSACSTFVVFSSGSSYATGPGTEHLVWVVFRFPEGLLIFQRSKPKGVIVIYIHIYYWYY